MVADPTVLFVRGDTLGLVVPRRRRERRRPRAPYVHASGRATVPALGWTAARAARWTNAAGRATLTEAGIQPLDRVDLVARNDDRYGA